MRRTTLLTGLLTAGVLAVSVVTGSSAAEAQGSPVGGQGDHYYLSAAGNESGRAETDYVYGNPGDEVYFGDFVNQAGAFGGDGTDDAMVRRGNTFIIRGADPRTSHPIVFGNPGDTVLVGDWDGDGTDTLAVRRGNTYYLNNHLLLGRTDAVFTYGDVDDQVLVGNWDQVVTSFDDPAYGVQTTTLMVRRGNHYFVSNRNASGVADYDFFFGDPGDQVLVGDWAEPPVFGDDPRTSPVETNYTVRPAVWGDRSHQLAVRRGNSYFLSTEVWSQTGQSGGGLSTYRSFAYGNPDDTAFVAGMPRNYIDSSGMRWTIVGDGFGVRRGY
jgi:hypothetical protein